MSNTPHSTYEPMQATFLRRLKTIPAVVGLMLLTTALLPLLLLVMVIVDAVRAARTKTPWMGTRLLVFGWLYLWADTLGLLLMLGIQLITGFGVWRDGRVRMAARVQRWWAGFLLGSVRLIFQLRFEVDGLEVASPGPVLVFMQHASMPDTLLPTNFITRRFGIQLRFVVKRELLVDPCLDIAGHWLPNYFVDRGATDPAQEVARIKALADQLGPNDGVLIYPEGTRFTREKQGRAIAKLREGDPAIFALAEPLRHVLPPRLGGPLALLDGDAQADVVFVAHHGFGGFGSMSRIWRGAMVRRTIRMAFWRVPRAEIPAEPDARVRWLYDHWHRMDAWMAEREGEGEA